MHTTPSSEHAAGRSVAIVGAGLAGLACAEALVAAGHRVTLVDKARGPGGRMSTRRVATALGEASFDHGAQYFTARNPGFREKVVHWEAIGVAAPWPAAGPDACVGVPAMNAPLKHLAGLHAVRWSARVDRLERTAAGWHLHGDGVPAAAFDLAVIALPAEQAATLLEPWDAAMAGQARGTPTAPCWTTMIALAEPLPTGKTTLRDGATIGWAARNSSKPGRTGPESWVVQASPDWSQAHLEADGEWVTRALTDALAEDLGLAMPQPLHAASHRWRYARSGAAGLSFLHDPAAGLGVCGDWLIGPRLECAWLSGSMLGDHIAADVRAVAAPAPTPGPALAPALAPCPPAPFA